MRYVGSISPMQEYSIQTCGQTTMGLPEEDMLDQAHWILKVNPYFNER
ncbi:MAG: hypothetical protein ACTSWA_09760 [Candidatus Thorarchaeota archaeon]